MATFWRRLPLLQRLAWALLLVAVLGLIGELIWGYATWPFSILIVAFMVLNVVGRNNSPASTHPQENDPNKR